MTKLQKPATEILDLTTSRFLSATECVQVERRLREK